MHDGILSRPAMEQVGGPGQTFLDEPTLREAVAFRFGPDPVENSMVFRRTCAAKGQRDRAQTEFEHAAAKWRLVVIVAFWCGSGDQLDLTGIEPEPLIGLAALGFLRSLIGQEDACRTGFHQGWRDRAALAISASDWVANTTDTFFLRKGFEPFADARGEHRVIQEQPGLIEDEQRGAAVEPFFQSVEQVGDNRGDRAFRVHQLFHFEADCVGETEAFMISVEQATVRAFQRERMQGRFQRVVLQHQGQAGQGALGPRRRWQETGWRPRARP